MNKITRGNLTAVYMGITEWRKEVNVPTCNVHHEWYKNFPVATFHHAQAICFKEGVTWYPGDLADLVELRKQWEIEVKRMDESGDHKQMTIEF